MSIIVLGQHVSTLIESSSGHSEIQILIQQCLKCSVGSQTFTLHYNNKHNKVVLCLTDTSLYIYIRVKHSGMANIKLYKSTVPTSKKTSAPALQGQCSEHSSAQRAVHTKLLTLYGRGSQTVLRGSQGIHDQLPEDPWIYFCNGYCDVYLFVNENNNFC